MTRSVSEYFRMIEERNEQYAALAETRNKEMSYHKACQRVRELRKQCWDTSLSKGIRQPLFAELRSLEKKWGLESNNYNGG